MTLSIAEKLARPVARAMRRRAMRWYVLCTVVSTFAGAAAAFFVKVLPRDANWRVTCGNDSGGWWNRGELLRSAVSRCARRGSGAGHAASVPRRARADEPGRTRTCMTGLTVKEAADIVAVLCARRRRVRRGRANRPAKSRDVFIGRLSVFRREGADMGMVRSHEISSRRAFSLPFFSKYGKNIGLPQKHEMREPPRPAIGRVAGLLESPTAFARRVAKGRAVRSRFPPGRLARRVSLPAASRVALPPPDPSGGLVARAVGGAPARPSPRWTRATASRNFSRPSRRRRRS